MRRLLRLSPGLLAAVFFVAAPAHGQHREERSVQPFFPCHLPTPESVPGGVPGGHGAEAHASHRVAAPAFAQAGVQASAQFEVTYVGFEPDAQAAFQAALDVWAQHVTSDVPIRIRAEWKDLGGNFLGSAGPYLTRGFAGAPVSDTWYPYPLADAFAGRDLDPSRPDIEAEFNSGYANWYLGTDGDGPPSRVELFTVVLHELGHGLGFIGSAKIDNGSGEIECTGVSGLGCFGLRQSPGVPFIFDRYAANATDCPLLTASVYPSPSVALGQVLRDEVFFRGRTVVATHGEPAPLYTPATWNPGSSYSHFDETAFPASEPDGLMTPLIAPGERKDSPGPLLCAALQDMGWTLAPACADLVPDDPPALADGDCAIPPPPLDVYVLRPYAPNQQLRGDEDTIVARDGNDAVFELQVEVDQAVEAFLFDARGRRVSAFSMGTVSAGDTERITVGTGGLAAGLYLLRVVGEEFAATRKVVRVR